MCASVLIVKYKDMFLCVFSCRLKQSPSYSEQYQTTFVVHRCFYLKVPQQALEILTATDTYGILPTRRVARKLLLSFSHDGNVEGNC